MFRHRRWTFAVGLLLVGAVAGLAQRAAYAADAKIDPAAEKILRSMADYYQKLNGFHVDLRSALVIEAPIKGDVTSTYTIDFQRPNRVAIRLVSGEYGATVVSDGKELLTDVPVIHKYTIEDTLPTLSEILSSGRRTAVQMIHRPVFMALALALASPDKVVKELDALELAGQDKIDGHECNKLKITVGDSNFEFWIAAGDKPWLRRVMPDVATAMQQGQGLPKDLKLTMTADFTNWTADPLAEKDAFAIREPADGKKVDSLFAPEEEAHPLIGKAAPEFELKSLDGKKFNLAAQKEKNAVLLDFWATWCGPCVQALPKISGVAKKYADKGLVFYAVNLEEDSDTIREFLKDKRLEVPVLLDSSAKVGSQYGADAIPLSILIDKQGVVRYAHRGFSPDLEEHLSKQIDEVLSGKKAAESGGGK